MRASQDRARSKARRTDSRRVRRQTRAALRAIVTRQDVLDPDGAA